MPAAPRRDHARHPDADNLQTKIYLRIAGGQHHNASSLAAAVGVSRATVIRVITQLRRELAREGADLVTVRTTQGWHYELRNDEARVRARWRAANRRIEGLLTHRRKPTRLKPDDEIIYGE